MNETNDWLPIAEEEEVSGGTEAAAAAETARKPQAQNEAPETERTSPEESAAPAEQASTAESTVPEESASQEEQASPAEPEKTAEPEETAAAREAAVSLARAETVLAGWEREAEAMREIYPAFDLQAALCEPGDFARLLRAGIGVRRAYETTHFEEILGAAVRYAAVQVGRRAAEETLLQQARPQENPVCARAAVSTATDVNSLTRGDILRILGEVSRGAKITFK